MDQIPEQKIHLAMSAIIDDISEIGKDRRNDQQGFRFRGIDDCYNHLHPILAKHGVVCLPFLSQATRDRFYVKAKNGEDKLIFHSVVEMCYRFTASDGSYLEARTVGEGMDYGDKSTAKALSAAHKYLLLQTFLIPTLDIADADAETVIGGEEGKVTLRDRKIIEGILADHLQRASEATNPALKKHYLGLASELRVQLADMDLIKGGDAACPATETPTPGLSDAAPKSDPKAPPIELPGIPPGPPWEDYHLHLVKSPAYRGKKLSELSVEEITVLYEKTNKNLASADPPLRVEAEYIEKAYRSIHKI